MQSLGFLYNFLPFKAVLDLFRPFQEFRLSQVVPDVVIPSLFRSSYWSSYRVLLQLLINVLPSCITLVLYMY